MPTIQKFYLHAAASADTGTLPSVTSTVSPNEGASGAVASFGTNRSADGVIGSAQTSSSVFIPAGSITDNGFVRWLSNPLGAQTIAAGTWSCSYARSATVAGQAGLATALMVWRPSTGALVGTIWDTSAAAAIDNSITTTEVVNTQTIAGSAVTTQDGDILVLEIYAVPIGSGSTTVTVYYDGTTEGSTTSEASNVNAPVALAMSAIVYTDSGTVSGIAVPSSAQESYYSPTMAGGLGTMYLGQFYPADQVTWATSSGTAYTDSGTATGIAVPSATDFHDYAPDAATVTSIAVVSATDTAQFLDAATSVGIAVPSASVEGKIWNDAATVTSISVVSATDAAQFVDAGTETAVAVISATEFHDYPADAATAIGVAVPTATDIAQFIDTGTEAAVAIVSATDFHDYPAEAATVIGVAVPSSADTAQFVDTAVSTAVAAPSAIETTDYVDSGVVVAVGASSDSQAFSGADSGTSTGIAAPSATDTAQYIDGSTSTGVGVPSGVEGGTQDSATATGVAAPSATDTADFIDLASAVAQAVILATDTAQFIDAQTVGTTAIPSATDIATFIDAGTTIGVAVPSAIEIPPGPPPVSTAIFDLRHGTYVIDEATISLGQFRLLARQEQILLPVGGDYIPV